MTLLRQVLLDMPEENKYQRLAAETRVGLQLRDCRSFNDRGMTMLFEVTGEGQPKEDFLAGLRKLNGTRHTYESELAPARTLVLAVVDRPLPCSASVDAPIICLQCPFNTHNDNRSSWKILVRRSEDLTQVLTRLEQSGVKAVIREVSEVTQQEELTTRQKAILSIAVSMGYFDFPRKVSLTALSKAVGVKPSTLSEILRSAERRIMENAVGVPFSEE